MNEPETKALPLLTLDGVVYRICDSGASHRYALGRPWLDGNNRTCATDGRACIMVVPGLVPSVPPEGRVPDLNQVMTGPNFAGNVAEWHPVACLAACPKCHGSGIRAATCLECEDEMLRKCIWCRETERIEWLDRRIQYHYAWLISQIPGVEIGVASPGSDGPVFFRTQGVLGAVAPLRKD